MDEITQPPSFCAELDSAGPTETSDFIRELYRSIGTIKAEDFKDWSLANLARILPFDSAFWAEGAEMGKVIFDAHLYNTSHSPEEWLMDYSALKSTDPLAAAVGENLDTTIYDADIIPREEWLAHPEFGPFCKKHDIQYTLCTAHLDPATTLIEVLSIYRASPDAPFSEQERLLMQFLFPHLLESRKRNQFTYDDPIKFGGSSKSSLAICDSTAFLKQIDPAFSQQLKAIFPTWQGPELPSSFVKAIQNNELEFQVPDTALTFYLRPHDGLFIIHYREQSGIDQLTPKEIEVAKLLIAGMSYHAGAEKLGITPSTFNKHANRLYHKLDIDGRAALIGHFSEQIAQRSS